MGVAIIGTDHYVPTKVLTNKDVSKIVDTSDELIFDKVGIKKRHTVDLTEATSDLALFSTLTALRDASVHAGDIDLIILANSTSDMTQPSTAVILQGKPGVINFAAFNVRAVYDGFVYALSVAYSMFQANINYKKALVVVAKKYSRILYWNDRKTCFF